ncbi:uncharacterized protein LOC143513806 isoform X2 [Brachyhypopomus gauderio]|uniref:uncharacterized protein LOC143513806 isoform X2 n=1 Tax=Brachyhypopomus gauderio TaxID=698409 RepID=UPI004042BDFF
MTASVSKPRIFWTALCIATWTLASNTTRAQASSASSTFLSTSIAATLDSPGIGVTAATSYTGSTSESTDVVCLPPLHPRWGSFSVMNTAGGSRDTVLVFWCQEGFQLVGSDKMSCVLQDGVPRWNKNPPVCEPIPRPEDHGLRLALLVSAVSSIIILVMSVSFIICCVQECGSEAKDQWREGRRGSSRLQSCQSSECWMERSPSNTRKKEDWCTFSPPKICQSLEAAWPITSPLHMGHLSGYENHGYERSQEGLLTTPAPGLYPHMVLQRVSTPSAPSEPGFIHLSAPTLTDSPPKQPFNQAPPIQLVPPPNPSPSYNSLCP